MSDGRNLGTTRSGTSRTRTQARTVNLRDLPIRRDDRVLLRAWQIDDLPAITEAARDPYIPLITSIPPDCSPAEGSFWLHRQWNQAAEGRGLPLAIVDQAVGEAVGMVTLNSIDWTHRRAAVGYWLLPRHRGRGLVTSAVRLVVELARDLDLLRVEALVEVDNQESQAVCRATGFNEEGTLHSYLRIGEHNRDMIMFARVLPES
ncbi:MULTISPECIES: GNAT family N-acetyltransferase [Actinoalloteichus]|uniref:Acetyltransferase, ribosomal protein N-acetylase n=1 Tax=Actinoalloteichus fjordicus TaxID=1612552 RepID=A0AAC9PPY6_9PSEU|nr:MULTISPECIES: GNAT family N-acetyltransferase [Actinoalloteichus]APU12382.1 acetyltransferase, ribosomal protein N-acetylase [Actinoalloteichus fjordicus]APU18334.1 acetyltransferase, ribosomal protein N-acetylase [Actinoalloteichus sp. GBA129-24]